MLPVLLSPSLLILVLACAQAVKYYMTSHSNENNAQRKDADGLEDSGYVTFVLAKRLSMSKRKELRTPKLPFVFWHLLVALALFMLVLSL